MIIKRKEGYYVIGSSARVHLGGPYKKRTDAINRMRQLGIPEPKKKYS